jgi:phosphoribosylglycinamide formyltransferase-1
LIDCAARAELGPARLVVVGANVVNCGALARARAAGLATFVVDHRGFTSREDFDGALLKELDAHAVDLVVLAGFMRLLGAEFLARYRGRVVNIHPALLPAFPGVRGQGQAFAHGVKLSGCTVHFVDGGVDSGAVIAQAAVPVLDDDDEATLSARILAEEHRLLPAVVRALAEGRVRAEGRRVRVQGAQPSAASLRSM